MIYIKKIFYISRQVYFVAFSRKPGGRPWLVTLHQQRLIPLYICTRGELVPVDLELYSQRLWRLNLSYLLSKAI